MKQIEDQIKYVLEQASTVSVSPNVSNDDRAYSQFAAWSALARHVLETFDHNGAFLTAFNGFEWHGWAFGHLLPVFRGRVAVVQGFLEAVERGLFISVKEMMIADVYADGIEIARDLLEKGHLHAAGTVAGIVLETRLRDLVKELELYEPRDTIAKLSQKLRQQDRIDAMEITWIMNMGQIRNKAAHGKETLTHDDVERLLQDVPRLLAGPLRLTS